jgi:hypothetical protein
MESSGAGNDLSRISRADQSPACMSESDMDVDFNDLNSSAVSSSAIDRGTCLFPRDDSTSSNDNDENQHSQEIIGGSGMSPIPLSAGIYVCMYMHCIAIAFNFFFFEQQQQRIARRSIYL